MMWRFRRSTAAHQGHCLERRRASHQEDRDGTAGERRSARPNEAATVAYETPLFEARERAQSINNEYRDKAAADVKEAESRGGWRVPRRPRREAEGARLRKDPRGSQGSISPKPQRTRRSKSCLVRLTGQMRISSRGCRGQPCARHRKPDDGMSELLLEPG